MGAGQEREWADDLAVERERDERLSMERERDELSMEQEWGELVGAGPGQRTGHGGMEREVIGDGAK